MRLTVQAALFMGLCISGVAQAQTAAAPGTSTAVVKPASSGAAGAAASATVGLAAASAGAMADDEDEPANAPPLPELALTDAQSTFRKNLITQREKAVNDAVGAHPASQGQRQEIGLHWRHVMRLLRIRELAEQDKNDAAVKKVDALLTRAETKFTEKMTKLGGAK